ncbi:pyridoxal-dependent decarboxylase [Streptomyces sp. NPDC088757]|uniref:pyridoxal-dependent decarboxylase n=1 Tax=Streptomyces sp. NPDC088757 TaxID=3365889 RepID=UPI0037F69F33
MRNRRREPDQRRQDEQRQTPSPRTTHTGPLRVHGSSNTAHRTGRKSRAGLNGRHTTPLTTTASTGTFRRAAIDEVPLLREAARPAGTVHLHVDAAPAGLIIPFAPVRLPFAFEAGADSIAVSGHKMIGLPMPCGIALARREPTTSTRQVEYVGIDDTLVRCRRDGLAVLLLWYALRRLGMKGLAARARHCLRLAEVAVEILRHVGVRPWCHPVSTTVVFDRPREAVARRWDLAAEGPLAHPVVMPHVTRESLQRLARALP